MANDNDDVIVNLSGDTSTTLVKATESGGNQSVSFNDEDADPVADLKSQFTRITSKLQTVEANQQQTVQQLADANQRLARAETQATVSQIETIEGGLSQLENDAQLAEAAYARAFEAGDGPAMARATRAMQRAEVERGELIQARDNLKTAATRQSQQQGRTQIPPTMRPADPVEAVAQGMSPKSAAWIRSHPECITDPKLNARMLAAHHSAIADGLQVDSDEYFEAIEKGTKPVVKKSEPQKPQQSQNDGRRPSSGAASGAGEGGGMNGGTTTVKLTAGEARSATDGTLVWNYDDTSGQNRFKKGDPIGLTEMARRKYEGMKAGLYDKNNFEA